MNQIETVITIKCNVNELPQDDLGDQNFIHDQK